MANWYYYDNNGQKHGPVSDGQLKQLALHCSILPETKIENSEGRTAIARDVKGLTFLETVASETVQPELTTQESTEQPSVDEPDLSVAPPPTEPSENIPENKPLDEVIQDDEEQPDMLAPSVDSEMPAPAPEATRDIAERIFSELQPILGTLNEKVDSLTKEAEFFNQLVAKKEEQIDKLYDENQGYKQGILEKFKKSLVLAVIGQIDAALKTISHFGNQEFSEENYRKLLANYNEIASDFQDSLAQSFDVVTFSSEENTLFDAKRQRALKTVPTEDETKHKTIRQSLRQGYEMANADGTKTLLRLEMVEVYVHQPPQS